MVPKSDFENCDLYSQVFIYSWPLWRQLQAKNLRNSGRNYFH